MNINYLSTRTNTNNNRRKQEHSQTNTDTEDRRQGHHNSLEPITVGPWCMHTNKDLQKYKLELHVIRSRFARSLAKFGAVDTVPVSEEPSALSTFRPLGYPIKP